MHIAVFVVLVTAGLTVNINVATESQPLALLSLAVYVPAAVMLCPFQVYGNWLLQIVVLVVLVTAGLTVRLEVGRVGQACRFRWLAF